MSTSRPEHSCAALDRRSAAQQSRAPRSPASDASARDLLGPEHHRVPGAAVIQPRACRAGSPTNRAITSAVTSGASPSVTITLSASASARKPSSAATPPGRRSSRRRSPARRASEARTRSSTSAACAPSTTTTRSSSATAHWARIAYSSSGRPSSVSQQLGLDRRTACRRRPPGSALRSSRRPRGSRPLASASRPPSRPWRRRRPRPGSTAPSPRALTAPRSSPSGADIRSSSSSANPRASSRSRRLACARLEPIAPMKRAGERSAIWQHRVVELGVVGEHRDRGRRVDPAELRERLLAARRRSPARRRGSARGWRTARAGRPRTGRQPASRASGTAAPRCRPRRTRSAVAAAPTTSTNSEPRRAERLGPQQLVGDPHRLVVELGRARACPSARRRPRAAAWRPALAPSSSVTSAARPPACAISANRPGSYACIHTSISPPHGSPTSQASESAIPKWTSCGGSPAEHAIGDLDDRALDAAARDAADHLAALVDGHLGARPGAAPSAACRPPSPARRGRRARSSR